MMRSFLINRWTRLAGAALCCWAPVAILAQSPDTLALLPAQSGVVIKSVFVDDPNFGKDPFFPESKRRQPKAPVADPVPIVQPVDGLELKGLSGAEPHRLAIINNRTFATGEEHPVRVHDQRIPVKCLEIRDNSVVVKVGEQIRELHFRTKL